MLCTLGLSLSGAYPLTASVLYIEDMKDARSRGLAIRDRYLWWSNASLLLAFIVLGASLLIGQR